MPLPTHCPCGAPLHYTDDVLRDQIQQLCDFLGDTVPVTVLPGVGNAQTVLSVQVPRHYIALHGIPAADIARLADKYGWERKAVSTYRVTLEFDVDVTIQDEDVINRIDTPEWQRSFGVLRLHDVLGRFAHLIALKGERLSSIEGWADMPDTAVEATVRGMNVDV